MDNHFYTSTEASQITECSRRQLQHWRDIGMVEPTVNPSGKGRNVYYSPSDLLSLLMMEHLLSLGLSFDRSASVLEHLKKNEVWFFRDYPNRTNTKHWMVISDLDSKIGHQVIDFDIKWGEDFMLGYNEILRRTHENTYGDFRNNQLHDKLGDFGNHPKHPSSCFSVVSLWSDRLHNDLRRRLKEYQQERRLSGSFAASIPVRSKTEMDVDILDG